MLSPEGRLTPPGQTSRAAGGQGGDSSPPVASVPGHSPRPPLPASGPLLWWPPGTHVTPQAQGAPACGFSGCWVSMWTGEDLGAPSWTTQDHLWVLPTPAPVFTCCSPPTWRMPLPSRPPHHQPPHHHLELALSLPDARTHTPFLTCGQPPRGGPGLTLQWERTRNRRRP